MGIGLGREEEGWWRTEIGEEGAPQGVSSLRVATWEKPPMDWRPVPPITAMWMGSLVGLALGGYRSGDCAQWRAAIPINRQIRKYRNKKRAGGNVRYEEVRGEGTEELKMPKQSHSRSGSDAFDVEDTPTMGMGGQTLYQPPSGSPPDDASSSLMPEGSLRASSQGQWNGRRYDRSPSPPRGRNPEGMAGYEVV